jgi:hypothetical protein
MNMTPDERRIEMVAKLNAERERLSPYFDRITTMSDDWKSPIHAIIPISELQEYRDAVEFFTATPLVTGELIAPGMVRVHSIGYRAGPAGDH